MEEVFDEWLVEARSMSKVVMEMEKEYVTPVYWRRLTAMRIKGAHFNPDANADPSLVQRGMAGVQSMRGKMGNLFGKLGRKGGPSPEKQAPAAPPGTLRIKPPKAPVPEEEEVDDEEEEESTAHVPVSDASRLKALKGLAQLQDWAGAYPSECRIRHRQHICKGFRPSLCLDIDPGPYSDPQIGRIGRFGILGGSANNESASYLPISPRPNPVAPYERNGGALWGAL